MTGEQDCSDAAATPALLLWSRLIQGAAAVVIVLSLTLLLSPRLGEAIFNLVYFHQLSMPVEVPRLAHRYIWFANGIIGAVMAGWSDWFSTAACRGGLVTALGPLAKAPGQNSIGTGDQYGMGANRLGGQSHVAP
jgi:hypothetical protein